MLNRQSIQNLHKKYRLLQDLPYPETCEEWWGKMKPHLSTTHSRGDHVMMKPEGTATETDGKMMIDKETRMSMVLERSPGS